MSNWAKLQEDTIQLPVFKRAKHGIHFDKGNGEILANFSGKPAHFQDTDGLWKPIDTKLLPLGDGYYGCPHSKVKVKPDGTVAVAGTDYVQRVTLPSAQAGLLDGDKLVLKFSFGEQRLWVTEDGFKSEIQLNRIPTLTEARKLIASESGTLSKEYLKSLTTATDANGDIHTYSTLSAFRTWLAQASFPVVIDPDFSGSTSDICYAGKNADYATARATSTNTYSSTVIYVGQAKPSNYEVYRGFVVFDTSSIDDAAVISQVNIKLTAYDIDKARSYDVQIAKYLITGTAETDYDGCLAANADDSIWWDSSSVVKKEVHTSGNLSTAWVNKTGNTGYGLRSNLDVNNSAPSGYEYIYICSSSYVTESYRPVLTVTYTAGGSGNPHYYYAQQ